MGTATEAGHLPAVCTKRPGSSRPVSICDGTGPASEHEGERGRPGQQRARTLRHSDGPPVTTRGCCSARSWGDGRAQSSSRSRTDGAPRFVGLCPCAVTSCGIYPNVTSPPPASRRRTSTAGPDRRRPVPWRGGAAGACSGLRGAPWGSHCLLSARRLEGVTPSTFRVAQLMTLCLVPNSRDQACSLVSGPSLPGGMSPTHRAL